MASMPAVTDQEEFALVTPAETQVPKQMDEGQDQEHWRQ
jgi:hypothetical protein